MPETTSFSHHSGRGARLQTRIWIGLIFGAALTAGLLVVGLHQLDAPKPGLGLGLIGLGVVVGALIGVGEAAPALRALRIVRDGRRVRVRIRHRARSRWDLIFLPVRLLTIFGGSHVDTNAFKEIHRATIEVQTRGGDILTRSSLILTVGDPVELKPGAVATAWLDPDAPQGFLFDVQRKLRGVRVDAD